MMICDTLLSFNDFSAYCNKSQLNIFTRVVMSGICQELSTRKISAQEFRIK